MSCDSNFVDYFFVRKTSGAVHLTGIQYTDLESLSVLAKPKSLIAQRNPDDFSSYKIFLKAKSPWIIDLECKWETPQDTWNPIDIFSWLLKFFVLIFDKTEPSNFSSTI